MKEKILKATLELACENGLGRISMSQIAQRAGIKKSSLYSHYSSKKEIIEKMYSYFRSRARESRGERETDYGELVKGRSLKECLMIAVNSYKAMNSAPEMVMFYKVIMSERAINPDAAEIMIAETRTMIRATKQLFYAMEAQKVTHFDDADTAAFSFAMAVHAIIDYEGDAGLTGSGETDGMMERYIDEFCNCYDRKNVN